jgi:hypothetical protein
MRILFSLLLLVWVTACAPSLNLPAAPPEAVQRERQHQYTLLFDNIIASKPYAKEARLMRIVFPLLQAGEAFCGDNQLSFYGFMLFDPQNYADQSVQLDGGVIVEDGLKFLFVIPGFPAAESGIQVGDVITAMDGRPLSGAPLKTVLAYYRQRMETGVPLQLAVRSKEGAERRVTLDPVRICKYPPQIVRSKALNAYADGKKVYVSSKMLDFAKDDAELALVMGHEIAHNILGHIHKKMGNAVVGSLLDALVTGATGFNTQGLFGKVGGLAYSQSFESEADYMGLYIMARAGYPYRQAADFWRRMAVENPQSIGSQFSATHPSTAERFVAISQAIAEIEGKERAGLPLVPNIGG